MEDIEITHAMTLKEDNYTIKHELNPSNGDYTIKDKNGNKTNKNVMSLFIFISIRNFSK